MHLSINSTWVASVLFTMQGAECREERQGDLRPWGFGRTCMGSDRGTYSVQQGALGEMAMASEGRCGVSLCLLLGWCRRTSGNAFQLLGNGHPSGRSKRKTLGHAPCFQRPQFLALALGLPLDLVASPSNQLYQKHKENMKLSKDSWCDVLYQLRVQIRSAGFDP